MIGDLFIPVRGAQNDKTEFVIHKAYGFTVKNNIRNLYHCMGVPPARNRACIYVRYRFFKHYEFCQPSLNVAAICCSTFVTEV